MTGPPVVLTKGSNVSLTQRVDGLRRVLLTLGWKLPRGATPLELDAQAIVLGEDGMVADDADLVFFSQLSPAGPPPPAGGAGDAGATGYDVEQLVVDLTDVPPRVATIVVSAAIYAATPRRHSFGQVRAAFVQVADADSGAELARHDLAQGTGTETAMVFGELYRHRREWKFRAVGQGYTGGLAAVARDYGVTAAGGG